MTEQEKNKVESPQEQEKVLIAQNNAEQEKMTDIHNEINPKEEDAKPQRKPPSVWKELAGLLIKIVVVFLAVLLLFTFFFGLYRAEDGAMNPMIREGDLVIFNRRNTNYRIGDLIVFDTGEGERQVRRVVAMAGDIVDIAENGLIVNGHTVVEHDIYFPTTQFEGGIDFPVQIWEGQVFVLGDSRSDNRVTVTDSRMYGPVTVDGTLGVVVTIIRRRKF